MRPDIALIAVTGGPCAGKTTFLSRAHQWLEEHGIYAITLSETATEFISAGFTPTLLGVKAFQQELFLYSLEREARYLQTAGLVPKRRVVILCDRGVLDCAAYMGPEAYAQMIAGLGHTRSGLWARYQMVIHLVTAADGAEAYYTLANNAARSESAEEARALDRRTQLAWLGHPHLRIIDNSAGLETKMQRALQALARTLHMPQPTEIERKFKVLNFDPRSIPANAVAIEIEQDYLTCPGSSEQRVRKRTCNGEPSYFFTEKLPTGRSGERFENERQIDKAEYTTLLRRRDYALTPVCKTRYCFPFNGKHFELDVFKARHEGLVILEIELVHRDEEVTLPPGWELEEVTDDPAYKNRALAEG